jgi:hypothetical protein
MSKPHTHFVTVRQLLAWMQNPTAAADVTPASLGCGRPGGAGTSTEALLAPWQQQQAPPLLPVPVPRAGCSDAATADDAAPSGKHRRRQQQLAVPASAQPGHIELSISSTVATASTATALVGRLSGCGAAVLIVLAAALCVVQRRREPLEPAATAGFMPHGSLSGKGVTTYVSSSSAAGSGAAVKGRAAHLAAEDSGYSSSPRFAALTPRTRMGSMA